MPGWKEAPLAVTCYIVIGLGQLLGAKGGHLLGVWVLLVFFPDPCDSKQAHVCWRFFSLDFAFGKKSFLIFHFMY